MIFDPSIENSVIFARNFLGYVSPWTFVFLSDVFSDSYNGLDCNCYSIVSCSTPFSLILKICSVQQDIIKTLKMDTNNIYKALHLFNRSNLYYEVKLYTINYY